MFTGAEHPIGTRADKAQMGEIHGHDIERSGDDAVFVQRRHRPLQLLRFQPVVGIENGGIGGFQLFQRDIAGV